MKQLHFSSLSVFVKLGLDENAIELKKKKVWKKEININCPQTYVRLNASQTVKQNALTCEFELGYLKH